MLGSMKSLYNLVRPQQQGRRDRQTEQLRGLEIDHQLEFGRLLYGQIGGLAPFRILSTYVAERWKL